jgi:hypothetical protein
MSSLFDDLPSSGSDNFKAGRFADPIYSESSIVTVDHVRAPRLIATKDTRASGFRQIRMDTTNILVRSLINRKNQMNRSVKKEQQSKK